jgi:uncharacterized protein (TIGR03032 family)
MHSPVEPPSGPAPQAVPPELREVRFEHTANFPAILEQLGVSLLATTYQAGKLGVFSAHHGKLVMAFHNFERAMGLALKPGRIAVGAHSQVWFLRSYPDVAPRLPPAGQHDACYLARSAQFTGDIHIHDLAWCGEELWIVNSLFSCLCTLHEHHSFVPRWRPKFISALAAEDRCHLNGLAVVNGQPKYVSFMAESDTKGGWRPTKATSGCIAEVPSGEVVARGFAMPHSPRFHRGRLFVLNSGHAQLSTVELATGKVEVIAELGGYTRGLGLWGDLAFVGLSKIRETSTFGGLPIDAQRASLKCGIAVVNVATGEKLARFEFHSGVEEIYDVQVLPLRFPVFSGPYPHRDGGEPIWTVPQS